MSLLDLEVERMVCEGALEGAGAAQGMDGVKARQVRQQKQRDGKGELFTMYSQSPTPWMGGDFRTHPSIIEITWGVLRGRASGKGVVRIHDDTRK
eukprot:1594145-Alexandrium_andersonii.AAC.1